MAVKLQVNGFNEYLERIQEMGANLDTAVDDMLMESGNRVHGEFEAGIKKHRRTGRTEKQLRKPELSASGDKHMMKVGFKLPDGLPARYINAGTPTNRKDPFISRALNKSRIKQDQAAAFQKIMRG